jgi:ankyrin repeat protein
MASQLEGCADLIKVLKSGGAHLDFRTRDGITALHKAVRTKNHTALIVSTHTYKHTHTLLFLSSSGPKIDFHSKSYVP